MTQKSNRFKRYGKNVTLDQVIKDCRELESELLKKIEELEARIKELEGT